MTTFDAIHPMQVNLQKNTLVTSSVTSYTANKLNEWTAWSSYSPCGAKTCYKSKQRFCYGKTPTSCGGNPNRYGVESKYVKCSSSECPSK